MNRRERMRLEEEVAELRRKVGNIVAGLANETDEQTLYEDMSLSLRGLDLAAELLKSRENDHVRAA